MKLINADELLEKMKKRHDFIGRPSDAVCLVEDAPAVDAVEIRRCSDCKWWDQNSGLTARHCLIIDRMTAQYDWCCWARPKKVNENA